jgi:hypothetical protein
MYVYTYVYVYMYTYVYVYICVCVYICFNNKTKSRVCIGENKEKIRAPRNGKPDELLPGNQKRARDIVK